VIFSKTKEALKFPLKFRGGTINRISQNNKRQGPKKLMLPKTPTPAKNQNHNQQRFNMQKIE